jgi:ABC-type branched-subunit amino acid transport system permease subunit
MTALIAKLVSVPLQPSWVPILGLICAGVVGAVIAWLALRKKR